MKPTLIVKLPADIEDSEMTFLLMSLQILDGRFNIRMEGFKGVDMGDNLVAAVSKIMTKQMNAKL